MKVLSAGLHSPSAPFPRAPWPSPSHSHLFVSSLVLYTSLLAPFSIRLSLNFHLSPLFHPTAPGQLCFRFCGSYIPPAPSDTRKSGGPASGRKIFEEGKILYSSYWLLRFHPFVPLVNRFVPLSPVVCPQYILPEPTMTWPTLYNRAKKRGLTFARGWGGGGLAPPKYRRLSNVF